MQPDLLHMQTFHHGVVDLDDQIGILEAELEAEDENIIPLS